MDAPDSSAPASIPERPALGAGFAAAFGSERGPARHVLVRELAAAQEQVRQQAERLAELEPALERETQLRQSAERALDRLNIRIDQADRNAHFSAYLTQMIAYAVLYRVPGHQLPAWAVQWAAILDAGALQGEFSPRRPYLSEQIVSDGAHGLFSARNALAPSRVRPREDPRHWLAVDESDVTTAPRRADVPTDRWRFGLTRSGRLDCYSEQDLRVVIAEARANAKREWTNELQDATLLYPCPASAYLTARQWLEDMPGFRAVINELRRRRRTSAQHPVSSCRAPCG